MEPADEIKFMFVSSTPIKVPEASVRFIVNNTLVPTAAPASAVMVTPDAPLVVTGTVVVILLTRPDA